MADRWYTFADALSAAQGMQSMQQAQQEAQQRQILNALALQQDQEETIRRGAFNQYLAGGANQTIPEVLGGQLMPQNGQMMAAAPMQPISSDVRPGTAESFASTVPQPTPGMDEQQAQLLRGQRKVASIVPLVGEAYKSTPVNVTRINKLSKMANEDADVQATVKSMGFDSVDFGYDEKTSSAWQKYTKTWTREELDKLAQSVQGGQLLEGLAPGKYTIEYDPINKRLRPNITQPKEDADEGSKLTAEQTLVRDSLREKLKREPTATEILDEQQRRKVSDYEQRQGGGASEDVWDFAARQYLATGQMPPMGRSAFARSKIMSKAAEIAGLEGIDVPELVTQQANVKAYKTAMTDIAKFSERVKVYTRVIEKNSDYLETIASKYNLTGPRFANMPVNGLRQFMGSGDFAALKLALKSLSNEVAKVESGSLGIAEVSVEQGKVMERIHDPNLSFGELMKVVQTGRQLGENREAALEQQLEELRNTIKLGTQRTQSREPESGTKKRMTFNPATGRIE